MEQINWGIIGAGNVCEVKSGPALQQTNHSNLIAVMRRNGIKAQDFATRHNVSKWYDDADALINDPEVNAIYIATPPDSHLYYTKKAAAAGKPVYVEKPMARNHQECVEMIEACKQANVPLYVAFYRRAMPNMLKIQELIHQGAIGDIRMVDIQLYKPLEPDIVWASGQADNWRVDPQIAGGGYFHDLASHQLDMMDFLFGPIVEASGYAMNQGGAYKAEDLVVGQFRFKNGLVGQGRWCFSTGEISDKEVTTIIGSKGQISFPFFSDHHVALEVDGKEKEIFEFDISPHIQQPLIQTIVDDLMDKGKCASTGITGARTNWVMDQICKRIDV